MKKKMSRPRVLLTGGCGYIGAHVAVALYESEYIPVIYDNFSTSEAQVVSHLKKIIPIDLSIIKGDVRDSFHLVKAIKEFEIDAVIHLAGIKVIADSISDPIEYYSNNISGMINVLNAAKMCRIQKIVFSSSASVYGLAENSPVFETDQTLPLNPYARSKKYCEEILSDYSQSLDLCAAASLRYFNPIGAHPSGDIGEFGTNGSRNIMRAILDVAHGKNSVLKVFGSDYNTKDGTAVRDYIHVVDLANAHVSALRFLNNTTGHQIFNIGTGSGQTVLELIKVFELAAGKEIPYVFVSRRPGDVAECFADVEKSRNLMNWRAERTLHQMCESAWSFELKNKPNFK